MSEAAAEPVDQPSHQKILSVLVVLMGLVPLLVFYAILLWSAWAIPSFEQMFKEMELSTLPFTTEVLLSSAHTLSDFWFISLPLLAGAGVGYMWLGLQKRARMFWLSWALSMADLALFFSIQYALMQPMFAVLKVLGTKN